MRRFHLRRIEDETGISGIGVVTEGVQFSDGSVAMRWLSNLTSWAIYRDVEEVIAIHGHGGKTLLEWIDSDAGAE